MRTPSDLLCCLLAHLAIAATQAGQVDAGSTSATANGKLVEKPIYGSVKDRVSGCWEDLAYSASERVELILDRRSQLVHKGIEHGPKRIEGASRSSLCRHHVSSIRINNRIHSPVNVVGVASNGVMGATVVPVRAWVPEQLENGAAIGFGNPVRHLLHWSNKVNCLTGHVEVIARANVLGSGSRSKNRTREGSPNCVPHRLLNRGGEVGSSSNGSAVCVVALNIHDPAVGEVRSAVGSVTLHPVIAGLEVTSGSVPVHLFDCCRTTNGPCPLGTHDCFSSREVKPSCRRGVEVVNVLAWSVSGKNAACGEVQRRREGDRRQFAELAVQLVVNPVPSLNHTFVDYGFKQESDRGSEDLLQPFPNALDSVNDALELVLQILEVRLDVPLDNVLNPIRHLRELFLQSIQNWPNQRVPDPREEVSEVLENRDHNVGDDCRDCVKHDLSDLEEEVQHRLDNDIPDETDDFRKNLKGLCDQSNQRNDDDLEQELERSQENRPNRVPNVKNHFESVHEELSQNLGYSSDQIRQRRQKRSQHNQQISKSNQQSSDDLSQDREKRKNRVQNGEERFRNNRQNWHESLNDFLKGREDFLKHSSQRSRQFLHCRTHHVDDRCQCLNDHRNRVSKESGKSAEHWEERGNVLNKRSDDRTKRLENLSERFTDHLKNGPCRFREDDQAVHDRLKRSGQRNEHGVDSLGKPHKDRLQDWPELLQHRGEGSESVSDQRSELLCGVHERLETTCKPFQGGSQTWDRPGSHSGQDRANANDYVEDRPDDLTKGTSGFRRSLHEPDELVVALASLFGVVLEVLHGLGHSGEHSSATIRTRREDVANGTKKTSEDVAEKTRVHLHLFDLLIELGKSGCGVNSLKPFGPILETLRCVGKVLAERPEELRGLLAKRAECGQEVRDYGLHLASHVAGAFHDRSESGLCPSGRQFVKRELNCAIPLGSNSL